MHRCSRLPTNCIYACMFAMESIPSTNSPLTMALRLPCFNPSTWGDVHLAARLRHVHIARSHKCTFSPRWWFPPWGNTKRIKNFAESLHFIRLSLRLFSMPIEDSSMNFRCQYRQKLKFINSIIYQDCRAIQNK